MILNIIYLESLIKKRERYKKYNIFPPNCLKLKIKFTGKNLINKKPKLTLKFLSSLTTILNAYDATNGNGTSVIVRQTNLQFRYVPWRRFSSNKHLKVYDGEQNGTVPAKGAHRININASVHLFRLLLFLLVSAVTSRSSSHCFSFSCCLCRLRDIHTLRQRAFTRQPS